MPRGTQHILNPKIITALGLPTNQRKKPPWSLASVLWTSLSRNLISWITQSNWLLQNFWCWTK